MAVALRYIVLASIHVLKQLKRSQQFGEAVIKTDNQLPETTDEEMQQHYAMLNPSVIELKEPFLEY